MQRVPDSDDDEDERSSSTKRQTILGNVAPIANQPAMLFFNLNGPRFFESEFRNIRELGNGSQGSVRLMSNVFHGLCAVKILVAARTVLRNSPLHQIINEQRLMLHNGEITGHEFGQRRREIEQLHKNSDRELRLTHDASHHQNIVTFLGLLQRPNPSVPGQNIYIGLVYEYMPGGSVQDLIDKKSVLLTEKRITKIGRDITSGLAFCHEKLHIIHRNVKPSSVLLTQDLSTAKIGDFGVARKNDTDGKTIGAGTLNYMAPEVLDGDEKAAYDYKVDVWSCSLVIYAMAHLEDAFDKQIDENALRHILKNSPRKSIRADLNDEIRARIEEGWKTNPEQRPTMLQMLERFTIMYETMKTEAEKQDEEDRRNGVLRPQED